MCLYPIMIKNPRYIPNKKNGGRPPKVDDKRKLYVPVGCGNCIECRRQLANNWKVRLSEELNNLRTAPASSEQHSPALASTRQPARARLGKIKAYFVTLTFSEDKLNWYLNTLGRSSDVNNVAATAIRHFLERWRKKYKRSLRHWLVTELGHEGTERIHLHGIVFTDSEKIKSLEERWGNGWVHIGEYCNKKTINYIVKYITKVDNDHKNYQAKVLASPGIGSSYVYWVDEQGNKHNGRGIKFNKYRGENTREYYLTQEGFKISLPMYYRNYIYNDEEKEKLWTQKLDKQEKYVDKVKYDLQTNEDITIYLNALKTAQKDNIKNGYGKRKWKENKYTDLLIKLQNKWLENKE